MSSDVGKLAAALELVSTPDLIIVLMTRFDNAVLVGERPSKIPAAGIELSFVGDPAAVKGWCEFASDIITDHLRLLLPEESEDGEEPVDAQG